MLTVVCSALNLCVCRRSWYALFKKASRRPRFPSLAHVVFLRLERGKCK